ncbi:MAG TPA: response regulator [Syntrophales bacterium]|nr:response regulator [Syntrophales bacterium]
MHVMNRHQDEITTSWSRKKVLLVDDFRNFIITMRNMLTSLGIVIIDAAHTGEEAVNRILSRRYDIVLCDYNLGPGKDGQQVLEEVKHRQLLPPLAIFMMVTAENSLEMIMGAAEYQPDEYLVKPFTKQVLERKLRRLLEKKEGLRKIEQKIEALEYEEALRICEGLIGQRPQHLAELLKIKGDLLIRIGAYEDARNFFNEVSLLGKFPWALLGLGRINYLQERYEEAARIYRELIQTNDKVMAAYDELAKTLTKMGRLPQAQEVLMEAVAVSPKAVRRQRELGDIAFRNQDLDTAQKAYLKAVKEGKFSCYKSPTDYTGLARVLTENAAPEKGLKVLQEAATEFAQDLPAQVQISIAKGVAFMKMGKPELARKEIDGAMKIIHEEPAAFNPAVGIDLARNLLSRGDGELGRELIRRIVRSNHEDEKILSGVKEMCKDLKLEDEGERWLAEAVEEVVQMNNEGVRLVQAGDLGTAIRYFDKATETLPENKLINANAAYALMLYLKAHGPEPEKLTKARNYLSRVHRLDPDYADLPKLVSIYRQLTQVQLPWMKIID